MTRTTAIAATLLLIVACCMPTDARVRTTRRGLKKQSTTAVTPAVDTISCDTITAPTDTMLTLSGFEKKLRSAKESMFVTNNTTSTVVAITFTIEYTDSRGRQLHKREVKVGCDIPSGETRQVLFTSWDRQNSFYYYRSSKPRRADGTPFKTTCRIDTIVTSQSSAQPKQQ